MPEQACSCPSAGGAVHRVDGRFRSRSGASVSIINPRRSLRTTSRSADRGGCFSTKPAVGRSTRSSQPRFSARTLYRPPYGRSATTRVATGRPLPVPRRADRDVSEIYGRWLALWSEAGPEIATFADAVTEGNTYSRARLLASVVALEGYWRTRKPPTAGNKPKLLDKLIALRKHSGVVEEQIGATDDNLKLLVAARNLYAHLDQTRVALRRRDRRRATAQLQARNGTDAGVPASRSRPPAGRDQRDVRRAPRRLAARLHIAAPFGASVCPWGHEPKHGALAGRWPPTMPSPIPIGCRRSCSSTASDLDAGSTRSLGSRPSRALVNSRSRLRALAQALQRTRTYARVLPSPTSGALPQSGSPTNAASPAFPARSVLR